MAITIITGDDVITVVIISICNIDGTCLLPPVTRYQFTKLLSGSITDKAVKYDYTSVMHYGKSVSLSRLLSKEENIRFSNFYAGNHSVHWSPKCLSNFENLRRNFAPSHETLEKHVGPHSVCIRVPRAVQRCY